MKGKVVSIIVSVIQKLTNSGAAHVVVGSFLTKFASFFGSIFIVRLLTKREYGVLSYYENIVSYLLIFAGVGLDMGLQRYLVLAEEPGRQKASVLRTLKLGNLYNLLLVLLGIVIICLYPHPKAFNDSREIGVFLVLCIPFVFCVNTSLYSLRALFDHSHYAIMSFGIAVILIIARVIGAASGGLLLTSLFKLIMEIGCAIICVVFLFRKHFRNVKVEKLNTVFSREMDIYSFQIMLTNGLWAIFMLNDMFFLGQLCGDETIIAEYKVAYVIPANLSILTSAIGVFIAPYFTKNETDKVWVRKKFVLVLKLTSIIMGVFAVACAILAKPIILLLYGEQYLTVIPIMRILLLASFFNNGIRAAIANILSAMGDQKSNLYIAAVGVIVQIVLDIVLIPLFGGIGVACASTVVYMIMSVALLKVFFGKYLK